MPNTKNITVTGDILIIDDKLANLQLLSSILKERGHNVRAVVNGAMGLVAARTLKPDLILLDIKMPEMTGYTVCRELKTDPALGDIPVIFISALEDTFDKVKGFNLGAVDYITKPFEIEEVVARVEAHLALYFAQQHAQEMAALRERQRLARDLHDSVSQTLFSAGVTTETLLMEYRIRPEQVEDGLQQIHQLVQAAQAEMRILLIELRPEILAKARLSDLLTQLAKVLRTRTNAAVDLDIVETYVAPTAVHDTFYRVAQEALNNIMKHAEAAHIAVHFESLPGQVRLTVHDDGHGFNREQVPAGHFGLLNMGERAEAIGALLAIESTPGEGTTVALRWTASEAERESEQNA